MTRVIDASVAVKWFFEEELSAQARALAMGRDVLLAPDLIVAEFANVAWRRVRTKQSPLEQAEASLKALPQWFDALTPLAELRESAFRVANALDHPIYDCLYVALAARHAAPLVTADDALIRRTANTPWEVLLEPLRDWGS